MPALLRDDDVQLVLKKTQPRQSIGFYPLCELTNLTKDRLYVALRELRKLGLVSLSIRKAHKDGSLVSFHKEPLPPEHRDSIKPRRLTPNGAVFDTAKTYQLREGSYTAAQLRPLAVSVLKELKEI